MVLPTIWMEETSAVGGCVWSLRLMTDIFNPRGMFPVADTVRLSPVVERAFPPRVVVSLEDHLLWHTQHLLAVVDCSSCTTSTT